MESKLTKFTDKAHLGGLASSLESRIRIPKMSLTLEEWLAINMIKFIEDIYKEI